MNSLITERKIKKNTIPQGCTVYFVLDNCLMMSMTQHDLVETTEIKQYYSSDDADDDYDDD